MVHRASYHEEYITLNTFHGATIKHNESIKKFNNPSSKQ